MSEDKPKRKKTSRACSHCQKSHMTCDSNRPCKRCVSRGLSSSCEDAPRKRRKYLADVPIDALSRPLYRSRSNEVPESIKSEVVERSNTTSYLNSMSNNNLGNGVNNDNMVSSINHNGDDLMKRRSKFLSSAADLEYSTLSNIISENFLNQSTLNEHTPNSLTLSPALSPHIAQQTSPNTAINDAFLMTQAQNRPDFHTYDTSVSLYDRKPKYDEIINQYYLGPDNDRMILYPDIMEQIETLQKENPTKFYQRQKQSEISFTMGILPEDSYITRISEFKNDLKHYFKEPEDIYEKVKTPYSYTPGYHSLIAYLRKRFNKEMLVKMAETMASYRPSFIACTNSLKEHDLIFMEQCFQRTLLTYDNIIKISGTPTIVWRRTGEIAYVGNEFCILTGWTKEELLLHRKTFIVELLDDKSVLEYFQLFLKIAFGDFFGATMSECTLITRKLMKIKTRCSWTLKRDVFGIPMMIIGNFLPIV